MPAACAKSLPRSTPNATSTTTSAPTSPRCRQRPASPSTSATRSWAALRQRPSSPACRPRHQQEHTPSRSPSHSLLHRNSPPTLTRSTRRNRQRLPTAKCMVPSASRASVPAEGLHPVPAMSAALVTAAAMAPTTVLPHQAASRHSICPSRLCRFATQPASLAALLVLLVLLLLAARMLRHIRPPPLALVSRHRGSTLLRLVPTPLMAAGRLHPKDHLSSVRCPSRRDLACPQTTPRAACHHSSSTSKCHRVPMVLQTR